MFPNGQLLNGPHTLFLPDLFCNFSPQLSSKNYQSGFQCSLNSLKQMANRRSNTLVECSQNSHKSLYCTLMPCSFYGLQDNFPNTYLL